MANATSFLLYSHAERRKHQREWRFVLQSSDGTALLDVQDSEPEAFGDRLELLAVLRGLEALDRPAQITVYTPSRYVMEGIEYGLDEWRRNGWNWERYGQLAPVKNRDLWQRLDRARRVHQVTFRRWRIDAAHDEPRVVLNRRAVDNGVLQGPHFRPQPLWARPQKSVNNPPTRDWATWIIEQWQAFVQWLVACPIRPQLR